MSLIESRVEILKQELKGIDAELATLNAEIEAKLARKAELVSRRLQITRLLNALQPTQEYIEINNNARRKRKDSEELDNEVYELLQKHGAMTQLQIAKYLGLPPSTAYHAVQRLLQNGKITKDGSLYKPL